MRRLITIAGPDGAGKTTVADVLADRLSERGDVERLHHRFDLLPRSATSRVATTEPHAQRPYNAPLSAAKILYLYLEWTLAWLTRALPFATQKGWIVLERGWWDLLVDPQRYRLRPFPRLVDALGRARPGKGVVVVPEGPAAVLHQRKQELPVEEIERQLTLWRSLATKHTEIRLVDVDRPVDEIVEDILALATTTPEADPGTSDDGATSTPTPERWVRLSTSAHHWYLPTRRREMSRSSLLIHQPMRRHARWAWRAAQLAAGTGALRILPPHEVPSIYELILPHIPPGGTAAISTRRAGTRSMALILDESGRPDSVIKLADTEKGRARLAAEVDAVRRFGPLLPPSVTAPEVRHAEPGLVVAEAALWKVRPEPWRLTPELARSMGQFFAQGRAVGCDTGPAHGDFAPWNVMKTDDGWCLIDWEDAGDDRQPFEDVFHYVVQAGTLLGRPHSHEVLDGLYLHGPVGEVFAAYADGAGIGATNLVELFDDYLDRSHDWDPEARGRMRTALTAHHPPDTR